MPSQQLCIEIMKKRLTHFQIYIRALRFMIQRKCSKNHRSSCGNTCCGDKGSVFLSDDHFRVWDFKEAFSIDEKIRENFKGNSLQAMGANDQMAINYEGHKLNFENAIAPLEDKEELIVTGEIQ